MIYNGKEVEFPAILQVSFFRQIAALKNQAVHGNNAESAYATALLEEASKFPELEDGITDLSKLDLYQETIDLLCAPLFPDALTSNEIKILTPPFYFKPLKTSARFDRIIEASEEPFNFLMKDVDEDTLYLYCCYFILGNYYGYPLGGGSPQLYEIADRKQGIDRIYKMLINADLAEFIPTERAVDITLQDYELLMENFGDMAIWREKFPPNSWIMKGVNIVNFVDVTPDQAIGDITSSLLVYDPSSFDRIRQNIRKILNDKDLHIGVINFEERKLETMQDSAVKSLLLSSGENMTCTTDMCQTIRQVLIEAKQPIVVPDSKNAEFLGSSNFAKKIAESEFNSYLIVPVVQDDELLGFFELGSKERFKLNKGTLYLLDQVMPIFGMAKKRFKTEAQNLVEAIIQQECTTIHSSVKWRFEEEAKAFMQKQRDGETPVFKNIVFDHLYPLYGQLDIKGSSERRNQAVSADLSKQLNAVKQVLEKIFADEKLLVYEELLFRVQSLEEELLNDLSAGSEYRILSFLSNDIYPVLNYVKAENPGLGPAVHQYFDLLDEEHKTVYEARKQYDTSVNRINQYLASYLDKKQEEAQRMFPHYFERYKTDGIEFNMYIGQSVTRSETFDPLFLRNLRLWQLLVMCEMENEFQAIKEEMDSPIEIASLILVYNTPISVHFRMDEKKFDVEGAYNARYEIIKKRVDKAHIKGTNERITRPGSLVIVYSQESDAEEYRTYFKFLVSRGFLKNGIEDLSLENLQGVSGLKALRTDLNYTKGNITVDEFIKELEMNS
ncbi:MAG: GAF domain-containing protein [Bacteroidota bacterium]